MRMQGYELETGGATGRLHMNTLMKLCTDGAPPPPRSGLSAHAHGPLVRMTLQAHMRMVLSFTLLARPARGAKQGGAVPSLNTARLA